MIPIQSFGDFHVVTNMIDVLDIPFTIFFDILARFQFLFNLYVDPSDNGLEPQESCC